MKFLRNQLNWMAYYSLMDRSVNVIPILAFPFNPYPIYFWSKDRSKISPLIPGDEARVGDEFWDFLLGTSNTTEKIFDAFKSLGDKDFGKKFSHFFE